VGRSERMRQAGGRAGPSSGTDWWTHPLCQSLYRNIATLFLLFFYTPQLVYLARQYHATLLSRPVAVSSGRVQLIRHSSSRTSTASLAGGILVWLVLTTRRRSALAARETAIPRSIRSSLASHLQRSRSCHLTTRLPPTPSIRANWNLPTPHWYNFAHTTPLTMSLPGCLVVCTPAPQLTSPHAAQVFKCTSHSKPRASKQTVRNEFTQ